jgi:hypothetical protein
LKLLTPLHRIIATPRARTINISFREFGTFGRGRGAELLGLRVGTILRGELAGEVVGRRVAFYVTTVSILLAQERSILKRRRTYGVIGIELLARLPRLGVADGP